MNRGFFGTLFVPAGDEATASGPIRNGLMLVFLFLFMFLSPLAAHGDGVFVPHESYKKKEINEPEQKAIIVHELGRQDLVLQVKFEGAPRKFGWLIPVPSLPEVERGSIDCFYELGRLTRPLVQGTVYGAFAGRVPNKVRVIEKKTVGAYRIAVLSAGTAESLERWLKKNRFVIPGGTGDILQSYIDRGWYFVAVRVTLRTRLFSREKLASGELHPLQISFDSEKPVFPLRISAANGNRADILIYVLSREPLVSPLIGNKVFERRERFPGSRMTAWQRYHKRQQELRAADASGGFPEYLRGQVHTLFDPMAPRKEKIWNWPLFALLDCRIVDASQMPECGKRLQRLRSGSWYLTRHARTFAPEEMEDLEFDSAIRFLAAAMKSEHAMTAAWHLSRLGEVALPTLLRFPRSKTALLALSLLQRANHCISLEEAIPLLEHPVGIVRVAGLETLSQSGDPRAVEVAQPLLRDSNPLVQYAASATLRKMTGEEQGGVME